MVSIIMPVYNVEKYVAESIQSVQKQTYQEWELIIINDGSTDSTKTVVEKFLADKRIHLVNQINQGVSVARNAGIALAHGQLIAFLDGDDLWDSTYLEKVTDAQQHSAADIIYCGHDPLVEGVVQKNRPFIGNSGNILFYAITNRWIFHIGAIIFSRDFILNNKLKFYVGCALGEDIELLYKAFAVGKAEPVLENLMLYRSRSGSATKSGWQSEKEIGGIESLERVEKFIIEKYDHTDKNLILSTFNNQIIEAKCRMIWKYIQHGTYTKAIDLLVNKKWMQELKQAQCHQWKFPRRTERKFIIANNRMIWKLITLLSQLKLIRR